MEALYQEAGRAGRNKQQSQCYVLLSEEKESGLSKIFGKDATYEELKDLQETVKFSGNDVFRQLLLFLGGLEPIETELN